MIDNITAAAIDDLANELSVEVRKPGDVSVQDLVDATKETGSPLSYKTVQDRMRAKIDAGEYTTHFVYDPNTKRKVNIYRKVSEI